MSGPVASSGRTTLGAQLALVTALMLAWRLHGTIPPQFYHEKPAPAPDSPLNCDAGNLLRAGDERGYNSLARMYSVEAAGAR